MMQIVTCVTCIYLGINIHIIFIACIIFSGTICPFTWVCRYILLMVVRWKFPDRLRCSLPCISRNGRRHVVMIFISPEFKAKAV
nr:MAG TPA: hypothetical protein [Caudoviricetes sp.]